MASHRARAFLRGRGGRRPARVASALAVVHFWFNGLVDIHEVARGFPEDINHTDVAFLMPHLEEATDTVLTFAPLEDVLRGPSSNCEG